MTDIVKRLRKSGTDSWTELAVMLDEAADEIEKLRAALKPLLEYEPTREDYGPLRKHDLQYESAKAIFKIAREALGDE